MKVYILMPTYNDAESILETLETVVNQTYKNYELIIINDGSTDDTEEVIKNFIKERNLQDKIKYLYQENKDQLNAIINGMQFITDDDSLVYILHSDDLFVDDKVLERAVSYFDEDTDVIIGDLVIIDADSKVTGKQKIRKYQRKDWILALTQLWMGRQLYIDFAFWRTKVFKNEVYKNYVIWNTPYWLTLYPKLEMIKAKNVKDSFLKYRVFEGNYIHSDLGLVCILNGELRCLVSTLNDYDIPFYNLQWILFRGLNKFHIVYRPFYFKRECRHKGDVVKYAVRKELGDRRYPYFESIINFYYNQHNREIKLVDIKDEDVYFGKDMRVFNKLMMNNKLSKFYLDLFKEMDKGFNVVVTDKENYEKVENILKFMSIYPAVKIEVR